MQEHKVNRSKKRIILKITIIFALVLTFIPSFLLLGGLDLFFNNDGIVNPTEQYQMNYRNSYSSQKPYFQWWYFTIKDLQEDRYFTFHYQIVDSVNDFNNNGTYVCASMVEPSDQIQWHKYEKYDYDSFKSKGIFNYSVETEQNPFFKFGMLQENTYFIMGNLSNKPNTWFSINCSEDTAVWWNLTLYRIYGWYGQPDSRWIYDYFGIINWNTYAHDCEVEGEIMINSTLYSIERNSRYRGYCDMNWGENFPSGNPAINHPWGWYYVSRPNADLSQEISIISGIGFHDSGFPFGTCQGQFADIRLNSTERIGVRQNDIFGNTSFSLMETSSDGELYQFDVIRSEWTYFTDQFGSTLIPLRQKVIIITSLYNITLDFQSELNNYNRLLFPHENYIFSDFEALGVDVHVTIVKHQVAFNWWDILKLNPIFQNQHIIEDFWSNDGGLEYGYQFELGI